MKRLCLAGLILFAVLGVPSLSSAKVHPAAAAPKADAARQATARREAAIHALFQVEATLPKWLAYPTPCTDDGTMSCCTYQGHFCCCTNSGCAPCV